MSLSATKWLAENLPALRRVTYTDASGRVRNAFKGEGFTLAFYFCDASNKYGTVFMTREVMSEKTGIPKPEIERLISAWIRGGFIEQVGEERYMDRGRLTPIYALVGIPKEYKPAVIEAENALITIPVTIPGDSRKNNKTVQTKESTVFFDSEPEPEPDSEPEPQPGSPKSDDLQAGRQRKEEEVLRLCIGLEIESMSKRNRVVKPGLRKIWEREYPLLIAKAIEQGQGTTHEAMAQYCYDIRSVERTGYTSSDTPAQVPTTKRPKEVCGRCENKNTDIEGHEGLTTQYNLIDNSFTPCELCNGTGYHDREPLTEYDYFPADEEPTPIEPPTKRVSAGVIGNTYIPTPPGSADPQSFTQLVRDISQNFTHK